MRRATIRDVAAQVGVSAMTVSNVINGKTSDVSEATRQRVEQAIQDLNYRIQRGGQGLRTASRDAVGIIIIDPSPTFLSDPFTSNMVAGMSNVLGRADMTLTIQGMARSSLERSIFVRQLVVDGFCIILSGSNDERQSAIRTIARLQQPFVLLQESLPVDVDDACSVREDDDFGGRLIAGHLMERGLTRVLLIRPRTDWPALENRFNGIRSAMRAADYPASIEMLKSEAEDFSSVQAALSEFLSVNPAPQVVVGGNDRIALGAMMLLLDRGLRIPEDVKVVGFNGFEFSRYARPSLTTVASPAYQMGEKAGDLMLKRLAGNPFPQKEIVFPVLLSVGRST